MFVIDRKQLVIGVLLLCIVVFGTGYKYAQFKEKSVNKPAVTVNTKEREESKKDRMVTVHITGAVKNPGVYTFAEGARINEAIQKAVADKDAEVNYLNLAEIMIDQQQITVPKKGEIESQAEQIVTTSNQNVSVSPTKTAVKNGKININTANAALLDQLPGVGPATAEKIIQYRTQHGRFTSVSQLLEVSGIGEKKFSKLKDQVTI